MISEPDVALTDFVLAGEAAGLAALAQRRGLRGAWVAFFASIAAAALLGGIAHGFYSGDAGTVSVAVWRATLLALGVTAGAAAIAGAAVLGRRTARVAAVVATAGWLAYAAIVLFVTDAFVVAVAAYLPAALFLLAVLVREAVRRRSRDALLGACGVAVLLAGSWALGRGLALHPLHFTASAVYHVIQMAALPLLYRGARALPAPAR